MSENVNAEGTENQGTQNAENGESNEQKFNSLDDVFSKHPELKSDYEKRVQSEGDKRVTEALKTAEKKRLEKAEQEKREAEKAKLPPEKQKEVEKDEEFELLKKEIADMKAERELEAFKRKLKTANIPESFAPYLDRSASVEDLKTTYEEALKSATKTTGGDVNPKSKDGLPALTPEQKRAAKLAGMTEADYAKAIQDREKNGGQRIAYATPK